MNQSNTITQLFQNNVAPLFFKIGRLNLLSLLFFFLSTTIISHAQDYSDQELADLSVTEILLKAINSDDWSSTAPMKLDWEDFGEIWSVNEMIYVTNKPPRIDQLSKLNERGISTIISLDSSSPPIYEALRNGMAYHHIPTIPYEYKPDSVLQMMNIIKNRDRNFLIHAGEDELIAFPYAAILTKWNDSSFQVNPWRTTYLLLEMGYPLFDEGGWKFVLSEVSKIQKVESKEYPEDISSYNQSNTLSNSMIEMEVAFENLKIAQSNNWAEPSHFGSKSIVTENRKIAAIAKRWISISDMEIVDNEFALTAKAAENLANAIQQKETVQLDNLWDDLRNSCQSCHDQTRDNPDFEFTGTLLRYIP